MGQEGIARSDAIAFIEELLSHSLGLADGKDDRDEDRRQLLINRIGLGASEAFEAAYRLENGLDGALTPDQYADLLIALKNSIGGGFFRLPDEGRAVRLGNTRCPFGAAACGRPGLCRVTSSVFGGIAARNFGYAKVTLNRTIASGDRTCDVTIALDRDDARGRAGTDYVAGEDFAASGLDIAASGDADGGPLATGDGPDHAALLAGIEDRMRRVWRHATRPAKRDTSEPPRLIARSSAMLDLLQRVRIVAPTRASVLISGETGVGKELVARAIHAVSDRWNGPFEAVNCGALAETSIESALFGHDRGAFPGANDTVKGVFERADGGTLFLDEIDALPPGGQLKLLRVLQDGDFRRVGGRSARRSDMRIVAASSCPLADLVARGAFRADLFHRLNVVPIAIPPLRARREDLAPLLDHFLETLSRRHSRPLAGATRDVMRLVHAHDWPGNVRELRNVLERSVIFCRGAKLDRLLLDAPLPETGKAAPAMAPEMSLQDARKLASDQAELTLLKQCLQDSNGSVTEMARRLGITPRAVHQRLAHHRIEARPYRNPEHPET